MIAIMSAIQKTFGDIGEAIGEARATVARSTTIRPRKPTPPAVNPAQKLLFDDLGELTPGPPRRRLRPILSPEQRAKRKLARERYKKRLGFLFGPQIRRKRKSRVIFALFPDVDDYPRSAEIVDRLLDEEEREEIREMMDAEKSTLPADMLELGQLIIKERSAMVRSCWSENKLRKANHFHVKPLVFQPLDDSHLHLESRDRGE